tara:strand:- start:12882 stop:13295 length:414 start_codon:yes stop_codon:yes gene_type:complete
MNTPDLSDKDGEIKLLEDGAYVKVIRYYNGTIKTKKWYKDDVLHRDGKPAFKHWGREGNLLLAVWYRSGIKHREDGPALIRWDRYGNLASEVWYKNGEKHREDGPARIMMLNWTEPDYEYYIDGERVEAFCATKRAS